YARRRGGVGVGPGRREFGGVPAGREPEQGGLAGLKAEVAGAAARTDELEQTARALDWEVGKAEESLRHQEAKLAEARQQIAGFDATLKHERGGTAEHEAELLRVGRLRADLGYRLKGLEAEAGRAAGDAAAAEDRLRIEQDSADAASAELADASARVVELDRQFQADQGRQMDLVRRAAAARSTAEATLVQVERFQKEYTRK